MFGAAMLPLELDSRGYWLTPKKETLRNCRNAEDAARIPTQHRLKGERKTLARKTGRGDYPPLTNLGHIDVRHYGLVGGWSNLTTADNTLANAAGVRPSTQHAQ